jgi:ATP-dependent Clp protease ATP-binding subunit ClpA
MLDHPVVPSLAPHARHTLERCCDLALRIHADEVGPEHLLMALMDDEDGAAHRAVVHAFADPETIGGEALAMASGILVSGSAASLPFSPGGVRALRRARAHAAERGDAQVVEAHLLLAASRALPADALADLEAGGWNAAELEATLGKGAAPEPVKDEGGLFRHYCDDAKRMLSQAAKAARQDKAAAIGPAHLLLACLGASPERARAAGLSLSRARVTLNGRTHDDSEVEARALAADDALAALLGGLGTGATTLELLGRFHAGGTGELAQLLERHRVTPALLERVSGVFLDPEST